MISTRNFSSLRKRILLSFAPVFTALASCALFAPTAAFVLPQQSLPTLHESPRAVQIGSYQTEQVIVPLDSGCLQRRQSNLWLSPFNNNDNNTNDNPGNGGSGVETMDPGLKLLICILIDLIGVASFAAPGLGEATDVGWAPVSALLVNYLFGNGIFTALALVEELAPGFDFIPTATIAWFLENGKKPPQEPISTSEQGSRSQASTPPPRPSSSQPRNRTPADSDVIDVDIID